MLLQRQNLQKKIENFPEKEDEINFAHVLECMLTLDKNAKYQSFNVQKVLDLRTEQFESYTSFLYCTHSSVYRVFWPNSRVSK